MLIERVKQAMDECGCHDHTLICAYADELVLLEARRAALVPEQRPPS